MTTTHALDSDIESFKGGMTLFAKMLSQHHVVDVVYLGTQCGTDGKVITLPELSLLEKRNMTEAELADAREFMVDLHGFVNHEVAHVLFTRMSDMKKMHDAHGIAGKTILNIVEDGRIEVHMRNAWGNAGYYLDHVRDWLKKGFRKGKATPPGLNALQEVIHGLCIMIREGADSDVIEELSPDVQDLLRKLKTVIDDAKQAATPDDAYRTALSLLEKLRELTPERKCDDDNEKDPAGGDTSSAQGGTAQWQNRNGSGPARGSRNSGQTAEDDDQDSAPGDRADSDDESRATDSQPEKSGDAPADKSQAGSDTRVSAQRDGQDHVQTTSQASAEPKSDGTLSDRLVEALQDFFDEEKKDETEKSVKALEIPALAQKFIQQDLNRVIKKYRVYTTKNDSIVGVRESYKTATASLERVAMTDAGVVRRRVSNLLKAEASTSWLRDQAEGKLDRTRLHRLINAKSKAVFKKSSRSTNHKSTSVVLAINLSVSMNREVAWGVRLLDLALRSALTLGHVLTDLGVPFEIHGHSAALSGDPPEQSDLYSRWNSLVVKTVKTFDEPFASTKSRLPALATISNTYDGEFVEWASHRLLQRKATRRLVVMLDDGEPCPTEDEMAHVHSHYQHLKDMVAKYEKRGVEIFGVGMGVSSVQHFYKRFAVLRADTSFAASLAEEFRKLLSKK